MCYIGPSESFAVAHKTSAQLFSRRFEVRLQKMKFDVEWQPGRLLCQKRQRDLLLLVSPHTAGISLYRDCLYRNLYVMHIYDVPNRVQRVFIINVESHGKCDPYMSNMASCIGELSICDAS